MKLNYTMAKETKTCYVFAIGERGSADHQTLYLKKDAVDAAGIDPKKGVTVTVEEANPCNA